MVDMPARHQVKTGNPKYGGAMHPDAIHRGLGMKVLGRLAMATALLVPVGIATIGNAGAAVSTASCTGAAGSATYTPGLLLTTRAGQAVKVTETGGTCGGGTVTSVAITTVQASRNAKAALVSVPVSCNTLLANLTTGDLPFNGTIRAQWNAGMGYNTAKISAVIVHSTGATTVFQFRGTTTDSHNSPFGAGRPVHGRFVVGTGLHTVASGGNCTSKIPLTGGAITGGTLNVN